MFPCEEFFWSAVFGAVGGVISVFFLTLLENQGMGHPKIVGPGDFKAPRKIPVEHDERFC